MEVVIRKGRPDMTKGREMKMHIIADCTHISIECEIGVENDSKSGYLVCGS